MGSVASPSGGPLGGTPSSPAWGPSAGGPIPFGYDPNQPGSPGIRAHETAALGALRTAAILGIVGILLGTLPFLLSSTGIVPSPFVTVSSSTSGTNNTTLHVNVGGAWAGVAIYVVTIALAVAAILYFRSTFRTLSLVDRRFSMPGTLSLLLLVGIVLLLLAFIVLLVALVGANGCALRSGAPTPPACVSQFVGTALAGLGLLVVAVILALIGAIGVLLGIWRVGTRYANSLLHVAAILYIIPLANLVAPILTYVAVGEVERHLASGALSPSWGFPTMAPPPPPPTPPPFP